MNRKPKAGVPLKEAMARGFNQVMGLPGVAYAKGGKLFNAALLEVDERGERVEPVERPDPAGDYLPDALSVSDTVTGGDDGQGNTPPAGVGSDQPKGGEEPPSINPLQVKLDEAQAELDAWVAANDATTDDGKREYARLYGRVRRAKDALKATQAG